MNGGACKENVIGATRHAYCHCPAGYNGAKCENRTYLDLFFNENEIILFFSRIFYLSWSWQIR